MEKIRLKQKILNIFNNSLLRNIFIIIIVILVIFPVFCIYFIFPQFIKQLTLSHEDAAVRAGIHLKNNILNKTTQLTKQSISSDLIHEFLTLKKDLNLEKIKLFLNSGEVIFSTDPADFGKFNTHGYFHTHIAKGNVLTKVVKKHTTTLENRILDVEVVETYVPIIFDGAFIGAIEIYYDITENKAALTSLLDNLRHTILIFTGIILGVVLSIILKASQNIIEKDLANLSLKTAHEKLEERIIERTAQLNKSNQSLRSEIEEHKLAVKAVRETKSKLKHSYKTQSVVNELLSESLGEASVTELLNECLRLIISLPWFSFESKGCVFLIEEAPDVLVMKVHLGFSGELKEKCAKLPFGNCLCGQAALTKKLVFSNHIDAHHTYQIKGMTDHGHYCVPIVAQNKVFGVINIYVTAGHEQNELEETFLTTIANTLAGILIHRYGEEEKNTIEEQLRQSQKLESIGQLAAGIAHEINTPIQYIGDNTTFLKDAFKDLYTILKAYGSLLEIAKTGPIDKERINKMESAIDAADLSFLEKEIPSAIEQSIEGVSRVSKIVTSMKEFSHLGGGKRDLADINHALDNTTTVARSEWKYVADLTTDFDGSLPLVPCNIGELNQVFLNMIINASHSVEDALKDQPDKKGSILIRTLHKGKWAQIKISDTGKGISEEIQDKIFDPFFTTKEVGKGTGQGLAISHSIIVDKHNGRISFETQPGKGTTFIIDLPIAKK